VSEARCPKWVFSTEMGCPRDGRFTPVSERIADMAGCPFRAIIRHEASFDHVVCASRERRRHIEPEGLGSL
jgi:hypothetical protein